MRILGTHRILLFTCAISTTLGCHSYGIPLLCFEEPLLTLHVYDETTGELIPNAVIVATDGVYTTHLLLSKKCYYGEAFHQGVYRPGTYDVTITADGYVPQVLEDIVKEIDDNVLEPIEVPMSRVTSE